MNDTNSTATAAESARNDGIALLAATAPEMAFAPAPCNKLYPDTADEDDQSLMGSIESEFAAYDHFVDEEDGKWTLSLSAVDKRNLTIDEAKRYLAECAAVIRAAEMLPAPARIAGASA